MKKILFLLSMFTLFATVTFAQDRPKAKAKVAKPSGWIDDSLLWVKKPVDKTVTVNSPGNTSRKSKQDKLGNFEIQDKDGNVTSPRDPASGQATGRRTHKPRRPNTGN